MNDPMALAAALPFRIIESLGIPCGYERSFKLCRRSILANRYILGMQAADATANQWMDAFRQLRMPESLQVEFFDGLPDANMVFFGFEDGEQSGSFYKVYLEYWDRLREKLVQDSGFREPNLLHKGFKWQIQAPDKHLITWYRCLPNLGMNEIRQHIEDIFLDLQDSPSLPGIREIIKAARQRQPGNSFLFVEISEPGNPRKSFDLNLYPAGLRVGQIAGPIRNVATAMDVPLDKLDRLMPMIQNKFFGHISGGISRTGEEYFTVYYEH
jgi:hypothetical protein